MIYRWFLGIRAHPPTRFLRLPDVIARTGLAEGRFPRPVSLGERAVGWVEAELDEWLRERIVESRGAVGETGR